MHNGKLHSSHGHPEKHSDDSPELAVLDTKWDKRFRSLAVFWHISVLIGVAQHVIVSETIVFYQFTQAVTVLAGLLSVMLYISIYFCERPIVLACCALCLLVFLTNINAMRDIYEQLAVCDKLHSNDELLSRIQEAYAHSADSFGSGAVAGHRAIVSALTQKVAVSTRSGDVCPGIRYSHALRILHVIILSVHSGSTFLFSIAFMIYGLVTARSIARMHKKK